MRNNKGQFMTGHKINETHGDGCKQHEASEHTAWRHMRERCNNPNTVGYKYWGKRGIKVCSRWLNSYPNFLMDMGRKPTRKHTLDRIDNDGNYEPNNCRWATYQEQSLNRGSYNVK